jgi:hypothetical protein
MSQSMASHRWSAADLGISLLWVLAAGPAAVLAGTAAIIRREGTERLRAVAVPALAGTILLMFYPDGSFSPRYVLAAAPLAFFPAAAPWLTRRPVLTVIALVVPLAAGHVVARTADTVAHRGSTLVHRLPQLPPNSLVVPGHFCPQARLAAAAAGRADLQFMCPGWDWPDDPARVLDSALEKGTPVAADISDEAWIGARERAPRDQLRSWIAGRRYRMLAGFAMIESSLFDRKDRSEALDRSGNHVHANELPDLSRSGRAGIRGRLH